MSSRAAVGVPPKSAFRAGVPRDVKAVVLAGILFVGSLVGGLFLFDEDTAQASMEATAVAGRSENGRLLFGIDDVALGSTSTGRSAETTTWSGLHRAERRADLREESFAPLASGEIAIDPINEARITFRSAAYVKDGILHELAIPQDTLRLRIPGDVGHPGDTLLLTFDVARSVADESGLLLFRPYVSEARWLRAPVPRDIAAMDPESGNRSTAGVLPEAQAYEAPHGTNGGGGGTGGSGGGSGGGGVLPAAGRASFFVRDAPNVVVDSLVTSFERLGVETASGALGTYFEGDKRVDLRKYAGPNDRAHLVTFQLPAGEYSKVHLEFGPTTGTIGLRDETLEVPQPHFVLERPFRIQSGQTLEFLIDFSLPESVNPSGDGWEFRPVAAQFQVSDEDVDGDGLKDPRDPDDDNDGTPDNEDADRDGDGIPDVKPAQYRTGGNAMPSIGETNAYYVQATTGHDPDDTTGAAGENVTGGKDRPVGSDPGGEGPLDPDLVGPIPVQGDDGQQTYVLHALSLRLMPSRQMLAPLSAVELERDDDSAVMLVQGPPGIAGDLRALPGVVRVAEHQDGAPFP